ncbi:hypothetical protein K435DRAFT_911938 [Dendrothele bispora CBS 962.96]|uniref:HNH nuclease domain-containing protein n=1 Tax=Dendrothele bispora (strain CBS 962.96) TaxID=1314807 RepID=A0A4S8MLJ7_DENBC|nr:hypothetical protein K435DRAFT_911938 [Dendrothele bispora CBS 962.96]
MMMSFPHPPPPTQFRPDLFIEVFFAVIHDPASSDSPENYTTWLTDPVLRIPKRHLWSFNLPNQNWTPYITYVCYAILGTQGSLSTNGNDIVVPEFDTLHSSHQNTQVYYHSRGLGFPTDFRIIDASVTHTSERDESFSEEVWERDQRCCFTGLHEQYCCDATHIVKHRKGIEYMERLLCRAPADMAVTDIDSPANGLLLNTLLHGAVGSGIFAFIRTPVSDVLKSSDLHENADDDGVMLTAHYIQVDVYDPNRLLLLRPNHGVYLETSSDVPLPPCYLFDAVYASHCLHAWSNKSAFENLFTAWSDHYYPTGIVETGGLDKADKEQKERDEAKRQRQKVERQKARAERKDDGLAESVARFQPLIDNVLGPDYGPIETDEDFWDMALLLLSRGPCPRQSPEPSDTRPEIIDKVKEWQTGLPG